MLLLADCHSLSSFNSLVSTCLFNKILPRRLGSDPSLWRQSVCKSALLDFKKKYCLSCFLWSEMLNKFIFKNNSLSLSIYIHKWICLTERITWYFVAWHCIVYLLPNMLHYLSRQNVMWQTRNLDFFFKQLPNCFSFFPALACLLE